MTSPIRPKERDAIIQSLRAGIVPRTGQQLVQVGRVHEITALVGDIDRVADRCGFGTATLLRHHFRRIIGVTPSDYRRSFSCDDACEESA